MQTQSLPTQRTAVISDWGLTNIIQMSAAEKFDLQFKTELTAIKDQIELLGQLSTAGGERQDATDVILAGISRLSTETTDAIKSGHVNSYSQERYAEGLKALKDALDETTARFAPKSKFKFKNRTAPAELAGTQPAADPRHQPAGILREPYSSNVSSASPAPSDSEARDSVSNLPDFPKNYNEEMARPEPNNSSVRKPSFSSAKTIAINGQYGLHIILPNSAARATSSGSLQDLERCIVDMVVPTTSKSGTPFAQLQIQDIKNSLIIAGHVDGAAHFTDVTESVVVVAARQVRLHNCHNIEVYMHVGSHPIIEDCEGVRVAPLPECYANQSPTLGKNHWDQVNDFKWLKQEPSPNWSTLPEEKRVSHEVWTEVVPGGTSVNADTILRKVGVLEA